MPRIPTGRNTASVVGRGTTRVDLVPRARARHFYETTPQIGRNLQTLGDSIGNIGVQIDRQNARIREEEEREAERDEVQRKQSELAYAKSQNDPTPVLLAARDAAAPDGSDLVSRTNEALQGWIDETANSIVDDDVRREYRDYWNNQVQGYVSQAAIDARGMRQENDRIQTGQSLTALENRVRSDPEQYDDALQLGYEVLAPHKHLNTEKARNAWEQQLGRARWDSMIEQATTLQDFDNLRAEISLEDWQERLSAEDYDTIITSIESSRAQARKNSASVARSLVTDLEQRTNDLNIVSRDELVSTQQVVRQSENAQTEGKLARVARNQAILQTYRPEGPKSLNARAQHARTDAANSGVPAGVASSVNSGIAQSKGRVSGSYLASVAQIESGGDPNAKSATSSAVGMYQFTEDTWLSVIRGAGTALVPNQAEMSDEEVLALRTDPELSARATAILAERNGDYLRTQLGREPGEFELYLAHFLGASQSVAFIQLHETVEDANAATLFPDAADANPGIFRPGGKDLTVQQVYDNLAVKFAGAPGRIDYEDAEFLERMANEAEKRIKENMMGYARETGIAAVPGLNEQGGFEARADAARIVSSTWAIPMDQVEPLEPAEVDYYKSILAGDDPDAKLQVMRDFNGMGPMLAQQAYKQLGTEGFVYGHAAGLLAAGLNNSAAFDTVRGQTFLSQNPDYANTMQVDKQLLYQNVGVRVQQLVGQMGADPASGSPWQSVMDSAYAHYIQTHTRAGNPGMDNGKFMDSVDAVLGGTPERPATGEVNGEMTVLPQGTTRDGMNLWIEDATVEDWTGVSIRGVPPKYENGEEIAMSDLRRGVALEAVGANTYRVKIDGQYAVTGEVNPIGRPILYVVRFDPRVINAELTEREQEQFDIRANVEKTRQEIEAPSPEEVLRDEIIKRQRGGTS